jgi:hypothetical protein
MLLLADAIRSLRPTSEFSYTEDDYSTIKWDKLDGEPPTEAEVRAEFARLKAEEQSREASRAVNKAALLERLGMTADEAALLLS